MAAVQETIDQVKSIDVTEYKYGFVTDVEGSGTHARIQVNFDHVGSKWLVLAYANLQPA